MTQTAQREPTRHRTLRVAHHLAAVPTTRRTLAEDLRSIGVATEVVAEPEERAAPDRHDVVGDVRA